MKPSTELFKLIKSLTKSEKRFFKMSSSLQSGDKNYLKIFDVIEKQNQKLEKANTSVMTSIKYARKMQSALLPQDEELRNNFEDFFIIYEPWIYFIIGLTSFHDKNLH